MDNLSSQYVPIANESVRLKVAKWELFFNLNGNWVDGASNLETAFLELHYGSIIDARTLGKYQNGQFRRVFYVLFQPGKSTSYIE